MVFRRRERERGRERVPEHTHEATAPVVATPAAGGLVGRALLTLLGAAGMIIGSFLEWLQAREGTELSYRAFYQSALPTGRFLTSAGLIMIVLGLLAIVGLAFPTGWLTRLAVALGIIGMVLFGISVLRAAAESLSSVSVGAWIVLVGSILALIGGFLGTRPKVVAGGGRTERRSVRRGRG